jgi:phosphoglycerate dehydrogenase-like enzyme
MEALLRESDFVSLHVPLTPATQHLIGARELEMMKATAVLINTARGPLIDQKALYEALKEQKIFAAALDVTDPEPIHVDEPILQLDNCVIVPHIGSASVRTREAMGILAAKNLVAALNGEPMLHTANQEVYL